MVLWQEIDRDVKNLLNPNIRVAFIMQTEIDDLLLSKNQKDFDHINHRIYEVYESLKNKDEDIFTTQYASWVNSVRLITKQGGI